MIDNTFNPQGAALTGEMATSTAEIAALSTTSVPEPASVALLVIGSVAMLGRRRNTIHRHRVMQRMVHHVMDVGAVNNALRVSNPRGRKRLVADGMRHPHAGEDADRFSSP